MTDRDRQYGVRASEPPTVAEPCTECRGFPVVPGRDPRTGRSVRGTCRACGGRGTLAAQEANRQRLERQALAEKASTFYAALDAGTVRVTSCDLKWPAGGFRAMLGDHGAMGTPAVATFDLDTLSEGVAPVTPGYRDEFELRLGKAISNTQALSASLGDVASAAATLSAGLVSFRCKLAPEDFGAPDPDPFPIYDPRDANGAKPTVDLWAEGDHGDWRRRIASGPRKGACVAYVTTDGETRERWSLVVNAAADWPDPERGMAEADKQLAELGHALPWDDMRVDSDRAKALQGQAFRRGSDGTFFDRDGECSQLAFGVAFAYLAMLEHRHGKDGIDLAVFPAHFARWLRAHGATVESV